ncbi:MAG TPA: DinB family protein [Urbifossiella sp.]|nr:DinB family protein [Urbifossiella sp.]
MTPTFHDAIAAGYRMAGQLIHRMTHDLTPDEFRHQPVPGSNSAAWVVGHLAVTLWRTADRLGAADLAPLPPGLLDTFTQTGKPAGDQSAVGDTAELLALFDACLAKVIEVIPAIPAAKLTEPATRPGPATTYGEGVLFGALHIAMHTGQLSLVRRSLGKPPVV